MTYSTKVVNGKVVPLTPEDIAYLEARDAQWQADLAHRQEKIERVRTLIDDPPIATLTELLTRSTAAQIDDYFAANVTGTAQAIEHLRTVCKLLALKVLPRGTR